MKQALYIYIFDKKAIKLLKNERYIRIELLSMLCIKLIDIVEKNVITILKKIYVITTT